MWMAVEIKSVGGLHWPQEWLPNPSKNCITVDFNCYSGMYCTTQCYYWQSCILNMYNG